MAYTVPMLLLSLFGGVSAERVQKKYVMLFGQAGSAMVALGIALALTLGFIGTENPDSWWILVVASILQGAIIGLMGFGVFVAGVPAEAFGVQWAVGGFAAILAVMTLLAFVFIPRIRKLD